MKSTFFILGISLLIGIGLSVLSIQVDETTLYDGSKAPPDALQGSVSYLDGKVMWQSRVATEAAKLYRSTSILQGEAIETGEDGEVTILFDEDTLIDIFSESSVSFTQTLPANIVITHNRGEVEYSQTTSTIPLSIRVGHLLVKLNKGAVSIVFEETKNEDDELEKSVATVHVIEGSVTTVYNSLDYKTNYVELDEGESLFYNNISRESEVL